MYCLLQRMFYKLHTGRTLFGMSHFIVIRLGKTDSPPANKITHHLVISALSHGLKLFLAGKIVVRLTTYWHDKRK